MKADIYNQKGDKSGSIDLPEEVFGLPWNGDLVHQVVVSLAANRRTPVAHTKDRSDVRGGGAKPWRQKGTGRARHGSRRSPIWKGGGVTFGPTNERSFAKKINRKMRAKALNVLLSKKLRDGLVIFVDDLSFDEPKTKEAKLVLEALAKGTGVGELVTKKRNAIFLALGKKDSNVEKSFNNFGNVDMDELRNLNALDVARSKYIVITNPKESVDFLKSKLNPSTLITEKVAA